MMEVVVLQHEFVDNAHFLTPQDPNEVPGVCVAACDVKTVFREASRQLASLFGARYQASVSEQRFRHLVLDERNSSAGLTLTWQRVT